MSAIQGVPKTSQDYWDGIYGAAPRQRLPSRLRSSTRNLQRLLRQHIAPGDRVLEIGCAPGKHLAWVAARLGATVAGVEYAPTGARFARELFASLGLSGDIRCEDVFRTSFEPGSFDVVYSVGVIEHFDDPRPMVLKHVELVRPGGRAVITIPNYGGIYGRMQGLLDSDNLGIHNLGIMSRTALAGLAPADISRRATATAFGRLDLALVSFHSRLPPLIASATVLLADTLSILQPLDVDALCPMLLLVIERNP